VRPDVVEASEDVVTEGAALMVTVKDLADDAERESVTFNVKLAVPAAGGVPLSKPPAVTVSHEGSVEPASAMLSAPVPPVAAMDWE
jgi:hypothetical protein